MNLLPKIIMIDFGNYFIIGLYTSCWSRRPYLEN